MPSQFTDEQTRQQYIVGIADILAQIFSITDSTQRQEIYAELEKLDDESLLEKQGYIEQYLANMNQIETRYLNQLMNLEHLTIEEKEKEGLVTNFNY